MKNDKIIKEKSYVDYLILKKKIEKDIGDTKDMQVMYDYIDKIKGASYTNVELDFGYFDFNYKFMCLTIDNYNDDKICRLSESIEIYDEFGMFVGEYSFDKLEKEVLENYE